MRDEVVVGALVVGFAVLVTVHFAIVWSLAFRAPRWRAPVALFVPPLAPYWAARQHMGVRAAAWVLGCAVYVAARFMALR